MGGPSRSTERLRPLRRLVGAAAAALMAAPLAAGAARADMISIGVSIPGSVFHSTGTTIAAVVSEEAGVPTTVQSFSSPNVYLPAVDAGQIDFGISNVGDARLMAVGEMHFEGRPLRNIRAAAVVFPLRMAIYVREDSPIRSIADLRGRRLPTGFAGQKTIEPLLNSALATEGLSTADVVQIRVPNINAGANAFIEGRADAFFFALGAAKVREADAEVGGLRALPLENTPESLAALKSKWPVGYLLEARPSPAYVGVVEPIYALTHDAILVTSATESEEDVYALIKALHDHPDALARAFAPFNQFDPDRMWVDIPDVEWHPGALRYFREIGMAGAPD